MDEQTSKACYILQAQIDKIEKPEFDFVSWEIQTTSIIKHYFTEDSEEYKFMKRQRYEGAHYGIDPDGYRRQLEKEHTEKTRRHLIRAKETLKIKGLYQPLVTEKLVPVKANFISHFSTAKIISSATAIFLLGSGLTQTIHEIFSRYSDKPLIIFHSSKDITKDKADTTTDSAEYKKKYDKGFVDTGKIDSIKK